MRRRRAKRMHWGFPSWLRRKMTYKRNHALHEYENMVLVALITERRCAASVLSAPKRTAIEWCWREPGRWDREYLVMAFKRLSHEKAATLTTMASFDRGRAAA